MQQRKLAKKWLKKKSLTIKAKLARRRERKERRKAKSKSKSQRRMMANSIKSTKKETINQEMKKNTPFTKSKLLIKNRSPLQSKLSSKEKPSDKLSDKS